MKTPLSPSLRNQLERAVVSAREVAEAGARVALESLAVHERDPYRHMSPEQRALRNRLRAHGRQLGDRRHAGTGHQGIDHLVHECAYEHWHSMLFARFLAENDLLIEPSTGVAVTLEECEELAQEEGLDRWTLASRYAHRMLPQVFRPDHPAFEVQLAREHRLKLEQLVEGLPSAVIDATDSLGWVYQFWQSRKKAEVNDSEQKIGAEQLPAVTQLFTEPYMVRFLLDNSLGAWWAAQRLSDSDLNAAASEAELRRKAALPGMPLDYLRFVQRENSTEHTGWRPATGAFEAWPDHLEELRILDPCCGSGHFLVAALSMLVPMRMEREALTAHAAVDAVLRDNLFGLEIDPRCVAVAAFAVALSAWRWPGAGGFRPLPELNLACSGLAPNATREEWHALAEHAAAASGMSPERDLFGVEETLLSAPLGGSLDALHDLFRQAPLLGSLIDPRALKTDLFRGGYESVRSLFAAVLRHERADDEQIERAVAAQGMARAAELLADRYHLVITNVPYLARGKQDEPLREFCEHHYGAAKGDLATVFLERCLSLCEEGGSASLVLPQNWLFLSSYRKLRERLLKNEIWHLIARLGPGAFETISGEVVKAILLTLSRSNPAATPAEPPEKLDDWAGRLLDQAMAEGGVGKEPGGPRDFLNLEMGLHGALSDLREQVMQRLKEEAVRGPVPQPDNAAVGTMYGLDVSDCGSPSKKAARLPASEITGVRQRRQLDNPDATITLRAASGIGYVGDYAECLQGLTTGDDPRLKRLFWEFSPHVAYSSSWEPLQGPCKKSGIFGGRESLVDARVTKGSCGLGTLRGRSAWGKRGVAIDRVGSLESALYCGDFYHSLIPVIVPRNSSHIVAFAAFSQSGELQSAARRTNQSLSIDNGYFARFEFDLDRWMQLGSKLYPNGLPHPFSDDPTQWIFHGHPCGSVIWDQEAKRTTHGPLRTDASVLQVAVARVLGYRWLAEQDADMELADEQREWVRRCDALHGLADEDGVVCISPVKGEASAAQRLRDLLAASYGEKWNESVLTGLLAKNGARTLDDWLRHRFFEQHCKLFHNRPFLWHIWDGRRDGFHALVNYHKLAAGDGKGRQLLETLTYSYLGDWITRQRDAVTHGDGGAEGRVEAALALQKRLVAIREGERPFDLFIRWKPIDQQPIGWEPDIDDGVRLNIRPFMADNIPGGRRGAGILRCKPNIHWRKDRGREPAREADRFPWFWSDGEFTGDRVNDVHLKRSDKQDVRARI
ncbi:MAG: N-6 DNA methylase [Gammaproteobacteria bacterium]|nr:N-6 DNA methylase [Gammaproteobacteria bacterium]